MEATFSLSELSFLLWHFQPIHLILHIRVQVESFVDGFICIMFFRDRFVSSFSDYHQRLRKQILQIIKNNAISLVDEDVFGLAWQLQPLLIKSVHCDMHPWKIDACISHNIWLFYHSTPTTRSSFRFPKFFFQTTGISSHQSGIPVLPVLVFVLYQVSLRWCHWKTVYYHARQHTGRPTSPAGAKRIFGQRESIITKHQVSVWTSVLGAVQLVCLG